MRVTWTPSHGQVPEVASLAGVFHTHRRMASILVMYLHLYDTSGEATAQRFAGFGHAVAVTEGAAPAARSRTIRRPVSGCDACLYIRRGSTVAGTLECLG